MAGRFSPAPDDARRLGGRLRADGTSPDLKAATQKAGVVSQPDVACLEAL